MIFSFQELEEITRGEWRGAPLPAGLQGVFSITDDSRQAQAGDLFVAISGTRTDGHHYLDTAIGNGAVAACVGKRRKAAKRDDLPLLCVDNPLNAFHELARAHRRRFPEVEVVGITGSNGKTSVRCMLTAILENAWPGRVLSTLGNTNNHFGVPRNLLRMTREHRVAALEIGTSQPGEIAQLTRLIRPRIGVITNIGPAHLENLGDTLGVAMEKGCLLTGLQGKDPVAIIPEQTEHVEILRQIVGSRRLLTFGREATADIQAVYGGCRANQCRLTLRWPKSDREIDLTWSVGGRHQALNAAAAAAAATALGLDPETIARGLRQTALPAMRMQIQEIDGRHWVNDAYNANPESMRSGIEWFFELTEGVEEERCLLILGDMLELGDDALAEHTRLLQWVAARFPAVNILPTGQLMTRAAQACGMRGFESVEQTHRELRQRRRLASWIFLKGSRGIELERLMELEHSL